MEAGWGAPATATPGTNQEFRSARELNRGYQPSEDAVIDTVKATLGSVQAPKRVHFVEALPKTPAGKVDKKAIRAVHWAGRDRFVG